jgi:thioesterase domain-containing protein
MHRPFKRVYFSLSEHYKPKVYPGKIVLFQSMDAPGRTPFNGWDGLAEEIQVVPIAGNHYSIFKEPNIRALAAAIGDSLKDCSAAAAPDEDAVVQR